jgi:hypothetical protein
LPGQPGPPGPPSDQRLKKDVKPITQAIEKISKIRGVSFSWKKNSNIIPPKTTTKDIGFIAQELELVLPEVVLGNDERGGMLSVKYKDIIVMCIEAIKEQSNLINIKEKKLNKLELLAKEKGLI